MVIMSDAERPQNLQQAWQHSDPQEEEKWRQAVWKEYSNMISHKVFEIVTKRTMPSKPSFDKLRKGFQNQMQQSVLF